MTWPNFTVVLYGDWVFWWLVEYNCRGMWKKIENESSIFRMVSYKNRVILTCYLVSNKFMWSIVNKYRVRIIFSIGCLPLTQADVDSTDCLKINYVWPAINYKFIFQFLISFWNESTRIMFCFCAESQSSASLLNSLFSVQELDHFTLFSSKKKLYPRDVNTQ